MMTIPRPAIKLPMRQFPNAKKIVEMHETMTPAWTSLSLGLTWITSLSTWLLNARNNEVTTMNPMAPTKNHAVSSEV